MVQLVLILTSGILTQVPAQDEYDRLRKRFQDKKLTGDHSSVPPNALIQILLRPAVGKFEVDLEAAKALHAAKPPTLSFDNDTAAKAIASFLKPYALTVAFDGTNVVVIPIRKLGKDPQVWVRSRHSVLSPDIPGERSENAEKAIRALEKYHYPRPSVYQILSDIRRWSTYLTEETGIEIRADKILESERFDWPTFLLDEGKLRESLSSVLRRVGLEAVAKEGFIRIIRPCVSAEVKRVIHALALQEIKLGRIPLRKVATKISLGKVLKKCSPPPKIDSTLLEKHDAPLPRLEKGEYPPPVDRTALSILQALLMPRQLFLSVEDDGLNVRSLSETKLFLKVRVVTYRDLLEEQK